MTPEQAIQILDMAAKSASMPRQQHVQAQEAISVLTALVEKLSKNGVADDMSVEQPEATT